jgi:branched-chain amino acid transport system permease protein
MAPFIAYGVLNSGGGWMLAIPLTLSLCVAVSIACEWANHAPLSRRNASDGAHLIASLGIYIIIVQVISLVWGNDAKALRTGLNATTQIATLVVTEAQLITLCGSTLLVGGTALFLTRTDLGVRLRALADNPLEFQLFGYDLNSHRILAFAMAGFLASADSLFVSFDVGFDPHLGMNALLLAVVVVIIGGYDSFWGPALAGALLGILRALVVWFLGAQWQDATTFILLVFFLFMRPQGLLGRSRRLEVQI